MNCPYCQNEMHLGYIPSWTLPGQCLSDGKRPPIFAFPVAEAGIPLVNEYKFTYGYKAEAYFCSKCKAVIAHTQDTTLYEIVMHYMEDISVRRIGQITLLQAVRQKINLQLISKENPITAALGFSFDIYYSSICIEFG